MNFKEIEKEILKPDTNSMGLALFALAKAINNFVAFKITERSPYQGTAESISQIANKLERRTDRDE